MLRRLTVENYALIEHLELELDSHLNIITGETGAGKSILLGALGLLLGNKNDGSAMRDASESCVIEGLFDISKLELREFFEENELEYEDEISIRRVLTPSGKSRSFIGDMPAPLSVVKELGAMLLDIHSQHQNLILQSDKFRTEAIDTLAANAPLKSDYLISFTETNSLRGELQRLEQQMELERRDEEWLRHQVEELKSAKLKAGELAELEQEQALLANADRIGETIATLLNSLEEEQSGILVQLKSNIGSLNHIKELYPESAEWVERLQSIAIELKDINSSAAAAYEHVESDPERLQRVDDRMALIYSLCQKHRAATLDELIEIRDRYTARLEAIEHSDEEINAIRKALSESEKKTKALATELHNSRVAVCEKFEQSILSTLHELGMNETAFKVEITPTATLTPSGGDNIEFLFSANRNFKPQPIERIASGGELSRVMLALKALLAERMSLPTILFDEIDTGVSGRIADAMGRIISRLSERMQVVDITHLPQVASKGETHFVVYKEAGHTKLKPLNQDERLQEIAKMLSGAEITQAALEQAEILLNSK